MRPLTILALLMLTFAAFAGANDEYIEVYSETFDTDPGWSTSWTPADGEFAQWTGEAYEVRVEDGSLSSKFAYATFPAVGDTNYSLEFDYLFTEISWGQPVMITFHASGHEWVEEDFLIHWDDSNSGTDCTWVRYIGSPDINLMYGGPDPELNIWYRFYIEFDTTAGTASWQLFDRDSGSLLWEETGQPMVTDMLDMVGIGCKVVNGEGDFSGLMIDNIVVKRAEPPVSVEQYTLTSVKGLFQ